MFCLPPSGLRQSPELRGAGTRARLRAGGSSSAGCRLRARGAAIGPVRPVTGAPAHLRPSAGVLGFRPPRPAGAAESIGLPVGYIRRSYCRRSDASLRLGEQGNFPTPVVPGARLRPDSVPQRDFKLSSAGQCPCQGERYRLGLPSPRRGTLRPPARLHAEFRGPMPVPGERYRLDFRPPARPQAEFRW